MKRKETIRDGVASSILALLFCGGCAIGFQNGNTDDNIGAMPRDSQAYNDGTSFDVLYNPIIPYNTLGHYSADPAACVIPGIYTGNGYEQKDVLMLVSSSDMIGWNPGSDWPMNATYLYATYGENNLRTVWHDYGIIATEDNFPLWTKGDKRLFAPDVQIVGGADGSSQLYFYIPDLATDNRRHIGIAHAPLGTWAGNLYGNITYMADFFKIEKGAGGDPPDNGYAFDPGVFCHPSGNVNYYYMVYADKGYDGDHDYQNLSIVQINDDMKSGSYLGKIHFQPPYNSGAQYSIFRKYMEGPDIDILKTPGGMTNYYLVFVAKVWDSDINTDTEWVGYAMADPVSFALNPTGCWNFKGWIFKNHHAGVANQVDLVRFNDKYYAFFMRVSPESDLTQSRSRQVCCKEIELNDKGEILGVTTPVNDDDPNNDADLENRKFYGTLDGGTKTITRGFLSFRDESINDPNLSTIHITSIKNVTGQDLYSFKLCYFITIEPGANMALESDVDPLNPYFKIKLERVSDRLWAVVIKNYVPSSIPFIKKEETKKFDFSFKLRRTGGGSNDKRNDPSQPVGDYSKKDTWYYTWTTRLPIFDVNADLTKDDPLCGDKPDIPPNPTYYLRTDHVNPDNQFAYLTVSYSNVNVGIWSKTRETGWTSQEWMIETARDVTSDPRYVRLRSKWTPNYYMTCNNDLQNNDHYFLLNQELHKANGRPDWSSQVWVKHPVQGKPGYYTFRCCWKPDSGPLQGKDIYLTQNDTWKDDKGHYFSVFVQEFNSGWDTQSWALE